MICFKRGKCLTVSRESVHAREQVCGRDTHMRGPEFNLLVHSMEDEFVVTARSR
jgi:hypothetical protein